MVTGFTNLFKSTEGMIAFKMHHPMFFHMKLLPMTEDSLLNYIRG